MIECPWCGHRVILTADKLCPQCRHEVLPEHLNPMPVDGEEANEDWSGHDELPEEEMNIEERIASRFHCTKCGHDECHVKEVAMSGAGLSKIFDIDYNHYLFVSCLNCGYVEVYNPDILRGYSSGRIGTILDILFGG
jgi:predicted nucleic-acid-binding Zn-ribbon protein